ncbi:helix-turn-helix domain-containing protein [Streptomyces sp. NPDC085995]|uniref:PucR family transcriptional regulator n=1 Tax=Streptomyces sp. NPDC085995 TaxID=3154861 RepID=UPI003422032B
MYETPLNPIVSGLAKTLTTRLDALVTALADVIVGEIENYAAEEVKLDDLKTHLRHNISGMLAHLTDGGPLDLSGPVETGQLRALQGVPLPEVLRAYRLGYTCVWDQLLAEASRVGADAQAALLESATRIWEMSDSHATAVTTAYRDAVAERLVETDRRRSALVAALVDGPPSGSDTVWEIARMLGFPHQGTFLLVVAETVTSGDPPMPGLDAKFRAVDVGSAWRAQPGFELGVLSCPRRRSVEPVLDAVRAAATGRVGVSPVYDRLDQTSRALRYAHVALESLPPGAAAVRQLDDTPLTELVMNNLETTQRAVHRILGGVLSLPDDDRTTLLATARAWLEAHGSAADAGRALYCHANTVRYRMHRLEEFLRGPLDDPKIIAELSMALDALGTFPTMLELRHVPHGG